MQADDLTEFERLLGQLCAAFEVPVTKARKDAYWTGLRKMSIAQFARLVDLALTDSKFVSMPPVGAFRKLADKPSGQSRAVVQAQHGPTIQEQLCDYVMLSRYPRGRNAKYSADEMRQTGQPWTYLYREWTNDEGRRCAECTAVLVPACGELPGFKVTVADMLGDPLHDLVLERFHGQARA
jgi:hypothetical protein